MQFFCFFFAFLICFLFAFFLLLFCFFPGKKPKKSKIKANKKQIEKAKKSNKNANGQVLFFPIFSPFLTFLCFPIYFASCFFRFWSFAFWFSMCFPFFCFFSSLKNIRTKGRGEHNARVSFIIYANHAGCHCQLSEHGTIRNMNPAATILQGKLPNMHTIYL